MKKLQVFDASGRLLTSIAALDLPRFVAERRLKKGWVLFDGDPFWMPLGEALAGAGAAPQSGIRARSESESSTSHAAAEPRKRSAR
jgi:hypothetical protein